jgi:hypothetical protein
MTSQSHERPTAYPELNEVLAELVAGAGRILGPNFCGAYLQGSFALGDADLHSDVDFMVVTQDEVSALHESQLQAMHELPDLDITWASHLEGSYVAKAALRRPDPRHTPWLSLAVQTPAPGFPWADSIDCKYCQCCNREYGKLSPA